MPSRRTEFVQYVFCTLTYVRNESETYYWKRVSRDWNRYIQRIRRLHGTSVGYLRTVESHQDLYPHLHAVLDFGSATIRVDNSKFFDKDLFAVWKRQWTFGLSDYQRPYPDREAGSLLYITKYITKSSASKRIWRELLADVKSPVVANTSSSNIQTIKEQSASPVNTNAESVHQNSDPTSIFCKQFKIKQCTWSRNFKFPRLRPKSLLVSHPLLSASAQ